jgi:hypothetical protein
VKVDGNLGAMGLARQYYSNINTKLFHIQQTHQICTDLSVDGSLSIKRKLSTRPRHTS